MVLTITSLWYSQCLSYFITTTISSILKLCCLTIFETEPLKKFICILPVNSLRLDSDNNEARASNFKSSITFTASRIVAVVNYI